LQPYGKEEYVRGRSGAPTPLDPYSDISGPCARMPSPTSASIDSLYWQEPPLSSSKNWLHFCCLYNFRPNLRNDNLRLLRPLWRAGRGKT